MEETYKKTGRIVPCVFKPWKFISILFRKDIGNRKQVETDNRVIGHQGIVRDITEQKRAEDEQKQLLDEVRRLSRRLVEVQESERREITRELHDRIGQKLTVLGINLNLLHNGLKASLEPQMRAQMENSMALVEELTVRIRNLMGELRPPVLDDYGLFAALRRHGERFSAGTGVTMVLEGEEFSPRLPLETETALFRITIEALINVVRHAQTRRVVVRLEGIHGKARLTISDEGKGFDPKALYQSKMRPGLGLITMRERAQAAGGDFRVESAPGKGTRIIVEVPRDK